MRRRELWIRGAYCVAVFLLMFVFLTTIHPIIVFNADDWTYIGTSRHAYPVWGEWNPTRVFPETFMPLCGDFAAYVIYPLTGNYLSSLSLVYAAVVSFFIAGYVVMLGRVLRKKCGLTAYQAIVWSALFLLLHFLVFRREKSNNLHLLYAYSATCCFYYIIPALLNSGLVMHFMLEDELSDGWNKLRTGVYARRPAKYGLLLLILYMALNSNLFGSAIFAAYIGAQLLGELAGVLKKKVSFGECVRRNILRLAYILLWGIVHIFEMNGRRAKGIYQSGGGLSGLLTGQLGETLRNCVDVCRSLNRYFLLLGVVLVIVALALFLAKGAHRRAAAPTATGKGGLFAMLRIVGAGLLLGAYLILLCSGVGPKYIKRPDVLLGLGFYVLFALILCGAYISKRVPAVVLLLPVVLCGLFFEVNTYTRTFAESNTVGLAPKQCIAISEDVIQQFVAAEESGAEEITLYVPRFTNDPDSNWPLSSFSASRISATLYKHGVISRALQPVATIPSDAKNEELGIPLPEENTAP